MKDDKVEEKEVVSDLRQLENTIQMLKEKIIVLSNKSEKVLDIIKGFDQCETINSKYEDRSWGGRGLFLEQRIIKAKFDIEEVMNYLATITRNVNCIVDIID